MVWGVISNIAAIFGIFMFFNITAASMYYVIKGGKTPLIKYLKSINPWFMLKQKNEEIEIYKDRIYQLEVLGEAAQQELIELRKKVWDLYVLANQNEYTGKIIINILKLLWKLENLTPEYYEPYSEDCEICKEYAKRSEELEEIL